jgi:hypothetical protein
MSLFEFKTKGNKNLTALFDIESGSVGVALIQTPEQHAPFAKPKMLWVDREEFVFHENISWNRLVNSMYRALEIVLERLNQKGFPEILKILKSKSKLHPGKIVCIFSSPWYSSETKLLHIRRNEPFLINEAFFKKIQQETSDIIKNEPSQSKSQTKESKSEYHCVEQAITSIKLNGYEIIKPLGKKARNVDIAVFISKMHTQVAEKVAEILNPMFSYSPISINSCSLVLFTTLRNLFPTQDDALIMHITGEVTDLSIYKKGVLLETVSFPFGAHSIMRSASIIAQISPTQLRSFVNMSERGDDFGPLQSKAQKALIQAHDDWVMHFKKALAHMNDEIGFLPQQVFIFSQDDFILLYAKWVSKETLGMFNSAKQFRATPVLSSFVDDHLSWVKNIKKDLVLNIESLYISEMLSTSQWL